MNRLGQEWHIIRESMDHQKLVQDLIWDDAWSNIDTPAWGRVLDEFEGTLGDELKDAIKLLN